MGRRLQVLISDGQRDRLRSIAKRHGRPMAWFIWRGITRHVIPIYSAQDVAGPPVREPDVKIVFVADESTAAKIAEFRSSTGRSLAWMVRTALEEYVFPRYGAENDTKCPLI